MRKRNIWYLLFNVFTPIILGTLIALLFKDDFNYLENLNRSIKVPPIVFSIAWSVLYLLSGIWYHIFETKDGNEKINSIYWISLFVNLMFVPILFSLNNLVLSLIDVIVLLGLILILFIYSISKKMKSAYLLVPYILWLICALALSIDLVINN